MKKTILPIILFLMFMPFVVDAKANCFVESGNGKDIGSELKCGTEHFYIVSSTDTEIKMLAKYNLGVGDKIDYFDVLDEKEYTDLYRDSGGEPYHSYEANEDCLDYAEAKGYHPYMVVDMLNEPTGEIDQYKATLKGCRVYEAMQEEHTRQDERAIGTRIVNGKSVLPLYGIVYMSPGWGYNASHNNIYSFDEYDSDGNINITDTVFEEYLNDYKDELLSQEIQVKDVSFITLKNTLKLLKDISGRDVTVNLEFPNENNYDQFEYWYGKMNIKDYVGNNNWIFSTTYWLGSGFIGDPEVPYSNYHNDYYISNEGMLCAIGRAGECQYLPYPIGNGLRPLVTIEKKNIKYNIKTKTDGKGTIEVVDSAFGGDTISFKVSAKKGLRLVGLTVTTDSNEKIVFDEEDITLDKTGVYSISTNKFTMPFENVTIEAKWSNDVNPDTGLNNYVMIMLVVSLVLSAIYIIISKKKNFILK